MVLNWQGTTCVFIIWDGTKYSDCFPYVFEIQRFLWWIYILFIKSKIDEIFKPKNVDKKQCYYYLVVSAICNPHCENGGTCVSPNVCSCDKTFTGRQCEIRTYLKIIDKKVNRPLSVHKNSLIMESIPLFSVV